MNALIKKSNCYGQQSLSQEAMDTYAQAVNVDPENVDIYFHRGQVNHFFCHHNLQSWLEGYPGGKLKGYKN